jgi:TPR repeat protein
MLTETEIHKGLLAVQDREYRFVLDYCQELGFNMPVQGPIAYRRCEERANAGDAAAQFCVAKLLSSGLFVKRDKVKAREWCEKAAKQNQPQAITMLAGFYESGWGGLKASAAKAIELFKSAAELNEPGALTSLAGMNLDGRGMPKDREAGMVLLRTAAIAGDALAQCALGVLLLREKESPRLEAEGLRWLRDAASRGLLTAHRQLGSHYRTGSHGLAADQAIARSHFDEASRLEAEYL